MPKTNKTFSNHRMPRLLELFSGTGSVRKAVGDQFDEIVSIDILPKFEPTEVADILQWNYEKYPPGYFDAIWASPPCVEYSRLKHNTKMETNMPLADSIVQRTLDIITYYEPTLWFIENPQTGLLKTRPFMNDIPFYDYDYCRFSDWGYKKRTRIWTNAEKENRLCLKSGKCPNMTGIHHRVSFGGQGRGARGINPHHHYEAVSSKMAYRIPPALIQYLFE